MLVSSTCGIAAPSAWVKSRLVGSSTNPIANDASDAGGAELLGSAPVSEPLVAEVDSPPPVSLPPVVAALVGDAVVAGVDAVVGDVDEPAEQPASASAAATNPIKVFERVL